MARKNSKATSRRSHAAALALERERNAKLARKQKQRKESKQREQQQQQGGVAGEEIFSGAAQLPADNGDSPQRRGAKRKAPEEEEDEEEQQRQTRQHTHNEFDSAMGGAEGRVRKPSKRALKRARKTRNDEESAFEEPLASRVGAAFSAQVGLTSVRKAPVAGSAADTRRARRRAGTKQKPKQVDVRLGMPAHVREALEAEEREREAAQDGRGGGMVDVDGSTQVVDLPEFPAMEDVRAQQTGFVFHRTAPLM